MSIAVGQENLNIKNPFRGLGLVLLLIGLVGLACSCFVFLEARNALQSGDRTTGYVQLALCLLLLFVGLNMFVAGLLRSLRFHVGRDVPASLAGEVDEQDGTEKAVTGGLPVAYSFDSVGNMLDGKEIAYERPAFLVDRLLYSLFPRLLYTPPPVRRLGENVFVPFVYAIIVVVLFAISYVVHDTSIYSFNSENVIPWTAVLFGSLIALKWFVALKPKAMFAPKKAGAKDGVSLKRRWLLLAVLLPVLLEIIDREMEGGLPEIPAIAQLILWTALGGSLAVFAFATLLLYYRVPRAPLNYGVSDERRNWEEDTHPSDLFRMFSQIMLELRRFDIPNRCYYNWLEIASGIGRTQTAEKGEFKGRIAHETQPFELPSSGDGRNRRIRRVTLIAGAVGALAIITGIVAIAGLALSFDITVVGGNFQSAATFGSYILSFLIVMVHGRNILLGVVQFFRSEILFESQMILFRSSGSFRTTKLTTGAGFVDSQRSESDLINSSFSVRLIASRITSSVFARAGDSQPFNAERYVVELDKLPELSQGILQSIQQYLRGRQKMSAFTSAGDEQVVTSFDLLNSVRSEKGIDLLTDPGNKRQLLQEQPSAEEPEPPKETTAS